MGFDVLWRFWGTWWGALWLLVVAFGLAWCGWLGFWFCFGFGCVVLYYGGRFWRVWDGGFGIICLFEVDVVVMVIVFVDNSGVVASCGWVMLLVLDRFGVVVREFVSVVVCGSLCLGV